MDKSGTGCCDRNPLFHGWRQHHYDAFGIGIAPDLCHWQKLESGGVLANRFTKFISSVSMEVYLSHMVIFRAVEKVGIHKMAGNGWGQYVLTVVVVLVGTVLFAVIVQRGVAMAAERMMGRRKGAREGR